MGTRIVINNGEGKISSETASKDTSSVNNTVSDVEFRTCQSKSLLTMASIDQAKFGWSAIGPVTDVLGPLEVRSVFCDQTHNILFTTSI